MIACGATNKQQIYAAFIGESGCGTSVTKAYNSGKIKIANLADMPPYWITSLSSPPPPQPVYTGASTPNDGSFTVSGKYTRATSIPGDNLFALIELPPNLMLTNQTGSDLTFTQNGTRLTAILPGTDAQMTDRSFNLTFTPVNPVQWSEDSVRINFFTEIDNAMSCGGVSCSVSDKSEALDSIKFAMQMLDIRYSDSIVARSQFGSATTEKVKITGWLVNDGLTNAFNAGALKMELWYTNNGSTYTPTTATVTGATVNSVTYRDSTKFVVEANIPNTENVCSMLLVLRKTGSGTSNPYLAADSIAIEVPAPLYEIMSQPSPICQMAENTSIDEDAIDGYSYAWSSAAYLKYLSSNNGTPVDFTYSDYRTNPYPDGTTLEYSVAITRPKGCPSVDTVFVRLKGIPAVQPTADIVRCLSGKSYI
jgi:hypothetical protein